MGIVSSATVAVMSVAVVTDSTACLPAETSSRLGISVVPLPVTVNGVSGKEGLDVMPVDIAKVFGQRRIELSTSRPSPAELESVYADLLDAGASDIVSVHLSQELSGTYDAASTAATKFDSRVTVVDSANAGMGLGFSVLEAARAAESGESVETVARVARDVAGSTRTLFYVDTLEFLRRGGRISAASALLGTALSVKPLLHVDKGKVVVKDKVRTQTRALSRLESLAFEAGRDSEVDVAVHHLQAPERAEALAQRLRERFGERLHTVYECEVGAVMAAHCGPGLLGVVVKRRGNEVN